MADGVLASSVAFGLTALITVPTFAVFLKKSILPKRNGRETLEKLYEDEDGVATASSERNFATRPSIYFLLAGSFFGPCFAIATAVQSTVEASRNGFTQDWLALGSWVSVLFSRRFGILIPARFCC